MYWLNFVTTHINVALINKIIAERINCRSRHECLATSESESSMLNELHNVCDTHSKPDATATLLNI